MKLSLSDDETQRLLGALEAFVVTQREVNTKTDTFLTNHWPPMGADVAVLKSQLIWIKRSFFAAIPIAGAAVVHLFFF